MSTTPHNDPAQAVSPAMTIDDAPETQTQDHSSWRQVAAIPIVYFVPIAVLLLVAALTGTIPDTMLAGFAVVAVLGGILLWLGERVPVLRDFGLPTILCTFTPAALMLAGLMPQNIVEVVQHFVKDFGFLDFWVVAVIAGCILGMPRQLLIKAGPRFVVPVIGCLTATFLLVGLIGLVLGFGFINAILIVAAPIMAGGLGIGAVPMAEMYAARTGGTSADFMSSLMSAVVFANIICILVAGIYNGIGKRNWQPFPGFNGYGQLLRDVAKHGELTMPTKKQFATLVSLGRGLMIAGVLFIVGSMLGAWQTWLHPYAWTIILAALIKLFRIFPADLEESSAEWGDLMTSALVPSLLVGVSISYINMEEVIASVSNPTFIVLTTATVLIATVSSGIFGWLVRFNFVEASITPGLVMADTGGSGDVSVLSAAGRLHLMPFAALTNRIGGALVLFVTGLLVPLLR